MNATIMLLNATSANTVSNYGYVVGAIIAILIMAYLIYALIKPEKL